MRFPAAWYQIVAEVSARLPALRPAQARGVATWLYGTLAGGSACQSAVVAEWLAADASDHAGRQLLREFLYDGADKAAPCTTQVAVADCFAPLLAWVLDWWTDRRPLPLAIDVTNLRDELAMLVVSVLYRGSAIPVAWAACSTAPTLPGQPKHSWTGTILALLGRLRPVVPTRMQVLVCVDPGLRSPRLRPALRAAGWPPLMRLPRTTWVRPQGTTTWVSADQLVAGAGTAWVGRATVYQQPRTQVAATLVVVWEVDQRDVWVLRTDLAPRTVGIVWYALRMWIELGVRALQGMGWQWQRTRRTRLDRVARHWLVLAVAMLWTLAVGTRSDDTGGGPAPPAGHPPPAVRRPPTSCRRISVFARGRARLRHQVLGGRVWTALWLTPERWPQPRPSLHLTRHRARAPSLPPSQ